MHNILNKIQQNIMLRFTHKRQASPAYKHKPVMNISFKQLNKLNNEANTKTEGLKVSYIL